MNEQNILQNNWKTKQNNKSLKYVSKNISSYVDDLATYCEVSKKGR